MKKEMGKIKGEKSWQIHCNTSCKFGRVGIAVDSSGMKFSFSLDRGRRKLSLLSTFAIQTSVILPHALDCALPKKYT